MRPVQPFLREQRMDGRLHLGLGLGLVQVGRHGPPMRAERRHGAGDQGGKDERRAGFENM